MAGILIAGKRRDKSAGFALILSLLFQGLAGLQYVLMLTTLDNTVRFSWQFFVFLGLSVILTVQMGLRGKAVPLSLVIRLFLVFLMGFPLGSYIWLELSLIFSLLTEAGLYLPGNWNLAAMGTAAVSGVLFQQSSSAFNRVLPGPGIHDLVSMVSYSLLYTVLICLLSRMFRNDRSSRELTDRLDLAVSRLAKANLGFQSYSSTLELDTLKKERKRVSREIHDTVGYSLTNIRIMLEAASFMVEEDPGRARELLEKSMNEAGLCLEETRSAMRLLRSTESSREKGIRAFFKLVSTFAESTGIHVTAEFGNSPDSFGSRIDRTIFRFIQEGLTNSFRHGRATEIRIYFWIQNRILKVSLQDNGQGAGEMNEGIGLTGMKERLGELGGSMEYHNVPGGFEISIRIPLEDREITTKKGRDNDSSAAG